MKRDMTAVSRYHYLLQGCREDGCVFYLAAQSSPQSILFSPSQIHLSPVLTHSLSKNLLFTFKKHLAKISFFDLPDHLHRYR